MKKIFGILAIFIVAILALVGVAYAGRVTSTNYKITTGDAASKGYATSTNYKLYSATGQPGPIGTATKTNYKLQAGSVRSFFSAGPDTDNDTIPDGLDNCPQDTNPDQLNTDGDGFGNVCDSDDDNDSMPDTYEQANACLNPLVANATANPDGDELINYAEMVVGTNPCTANPELALDSDSDGFKDGKERYMGTDQADACSDNSTDPAWPPDINNNKLVNIIDVLFFGGHMGAKIGESNYDKRYDFDANGTINIIDVLFFGPYMTKTCT